MQASSVELPGIVQNGDPYAARNISPPKVAPAFVPTSLGRLAVFDHGGSGPPILMWPSLFSDHRLYDFLIPLVAPRWRVIALDGPGFGQSSPPAGRVQPSAYAGAVVQLLHSLGIARAAFVGTSWGGQIGAMLAATDACRVAGLVMLNTPLAPSSGGHWFKVAMARLMVSSPVYARVVARAMLAPVTHARHPARVAAFTAAFGDFDRKAAAITANTTLRHFSGLGAVLPRLNLPTVMVFGAEDRLYPVDRMRREAALVPAAHIRILPDCGHLAPLEAPEAVADIVDALAANMKW